MLIQSLLKASVRRNGLLAASLHFVFSSRQRAARASSFELRPRDVAAARRFQTVLFRRPLVAHPGAVSSLRPGAPKVRSGAVEDRDRECPNIDPRRHASKPGMYPDALRRVTYFDLENERRLKFLTNNFSLPALTIAKIYKSRWMVELFFKFIKSHLRIKSFYGTSATAVKTQIWIAVSTYVLVAIIRKRLQLQSSFYQILQILSLTLFEKMPILQALEAAESQNELGEDANQLILFEF